MAELVLQSGAWHARVLPDAGGLIAALACGDVPVLRAMPPGSRSPLDAACFPLVPWCNRIAEGRFAWDGAEVALSRNFLPERHAIHGHGWQSAWAVESHGPGNCTLVHRHDGTAPGWPWAYLARQQIVEGAVGMVEMALQRLSEKDVVQLDEERKAAMVSNLLVVLCGDHSVSPVINTGTIY